jgi:hypothetical protein
MRTTLDIEDDILQAAKELAARERSTAGAVISRLAREGLQQPAKGVFSMARTKLTVKNGIPVFPARPGEVVTLDHVQKIIDEEAI